MKLSITDNYKKITVEVESEEMTVGAVVEQLFRPAMLGIGYADQSLVKQIGEIDDKGILEGFDIHCNWEDGEDED